MGEHDEPVHPGGLNLYLPKTAGRAKAPKAPEPPKLSEESEVHGQKYTVPGQPVVRSIFRALEVMAKARGTAPEAALRAVSKLASSGPTTTQVAQALDVQDSVWVDPDVHPLLLLRDLTRLYGTDWLSWEPETIWSEIEEDESRGAEVPRANKDKVMALRVAVKTDLPWKELAVFENVALAFTGMVPRFDVMQPLEPYQIALAVDVLYKIQPGIEYDDDVLGYAAAILVHDGLSWVPPEIFGDVEPQMAMLRHDSTVADAVKAAWGAGTEPDPDTAEGGQVATLLAIREYLAMMAEQLQLTPELPVQEYDAEADPSMPFPPAAGISPQAAGGQ